MLLVAFVLMSFTTLRPNTLPGNGTAEDPYIISDETGWGVFTEWINNYNDTYGDKYYLLDADIHPGTTYNPLTTVVGKDKNNAFRGHFDGGGNTISIFLYRMEEFAAPFGVIDAATIENLTVAGNITSTKKYIAGIAAYANNSDTSFFYNCVSSVEIYCNVTDNSCDASAGGLLGQNEKGVTCFENCVFNGRISGIDNTQKCGGFINYSGSNKCAIHYTNCLMLGTIDVSTNIATFHRGQAKPTFTNSYYLNNYSGANPQGLKLETSAPDDAIVKRITFGNTDYFAAGNVTVSAEAEYPYTTRVISAEPVVTDGSAVLAKGTDYAVSYKYKVGENYEEVQQVKEAGFYQMIVSGLGNYGGSVTNEFEVVAFGNTWGELQEALNSKSVVVLTNDFYAEDTDEMLTISRTATLDLNGHTINRNLTEARANGCVILVKYQGAEKGNLTITDSSEDGEGMITGGWNLGNGGGIVNNGTLTLQAGTISGNKSEDNGASQSRQWGTGAGIYSNGSNAYFYMKGGAVNGNTAAGGGGGIHSTSNVKAFEITGGEIKNNSGNTKGGGIRVASKNAVISGCVITGNSANNASQGDGGGIYVEKTSLTLKNCSIYGNYAEKFTHVIYVEADSKTGAGSYNIVLGNNMVNSDMIHSTNGLTPASVSLAGRALYKDGDWNTLCLPFSMSAEQIAESPLAGCELAVLDVQNKYDSNGNVDNENGRLTGFNAETGELVINFATSDIIEAGKPYLIKWEKVQDYDPAESETYDLHDPVFEGVTLNSSNDTTISFIGGKCVGTYSPIVFNGNHGSMLLLGLNSQMYVPESGSVLYSQRVYFDFSDSGYEAPSRIVTTFNENNISSGLEHTTQQSVVTKFWENGQFFIRRDGVTYDALGRNVK